MKSFGIHSGLASAAWLVVATSGQAAEVLRNDHASLSVDGRLQMFGVAEDVPDDARRDGRLFLFAKQARLSFYGAREDYKFYSEFAFGGEDQVVAPSPGISLGLLEFRFDVPIWEKFFLRVGQFKVPFDSESLADDGALLFDDRSIASLAFRLGRDVGGAFGWRSDLASAAFGVFTGGGRDNPERYLPEDLGVPLLVFRAGFDSTSGDAFSNVQSGVFSVDKTQIATYLNAAYMEDSLVGHSSVLNVRSSEKSLLLNANWNPFIASAPFSKGTVWQFALDSTVRTPVGGSVLSAQMELNEAGYTNGYGTVHLRGGRAQASLAVKPVEFALRYSALFPDEGFAYKGKPITGSQPFQELTPAVTYHMREWSKFIFEVPLFINVPVVQETGVGAYVLTEQPDQTTVLAGKGTVSRQNVPEIRALWQLSF